MKTQAISDIWILREEVINIHHSIFSPYVQKNSLVSHIMSYCYNVLDEMSAAQYLPEKDLEEKRTILREKVKVLYDHKKWVFLYNKLYNLYLAASLNNSKSSPMVNDYIVRCRRCLTNIEVVWNDNEQFGDLTPAKINKQFNKISKQIDELEKEFTLVRLC